MPVISHVVTKTKHSTQALPSQFDIQETKIKNATTIIITTTTAAIRTIKQNKFPLGTFEFLFLVIKSKNNNDNKRNKKAKKKYNEKNETNKLFRHHHQYTLTCLYVL